MNNIEFLYVDEHAENNWFWKRYFYGGGNSRYYTFHAALNIVNQTHTEPVIIETGCQRQEEDVGAGMSTSIFAEYIARYGGRLITVDIVPEHLARAQSYTVKWPGSEIQFVEQDSVAFLATYDGPVNLLYLDSLDYPIAENEGNTQMQEAAQSHCLNEFKAVESQLKPGCVLLIDDNQLPGGGKAKTLKQHLVERDEWTLILDLQSSLWIRGA